MGLSAFDRHQWLMKDAIKYYRAQLPPEQQTLKTDYDVLKEQYRSDLKHALCYLVFTSMHHDIVFPVNTD